MKGLIALDIDGTVTSNIHGIDSKVINALHAWASEGWVIAFITGRTFSWAYASLKPLDFPYYFSVQNGALCMLMPERKPVCKHYLNDAILPELNSYFDNLSTDYAVYSGYEDGDRCYYRPKKFSEELLTYLAARTAALKENWIAVDDFNFLKNKTFASVKTFIKGEQAQVIAQKLEDAFHLHAPVNRDPFDSAYNIIQATDSQVSKGAIVGELRTFLDPDCPVIAAGDDLNDLSLLEAADIKIAMQAAPSQLLKIADIIAPAVEELGLIVGLEQAVSMLNQKDLS